MKTGWEGMRPLGKLRFLLDRTAVLFIGIAVGAIVAFSFFRGGAPRQEAPVPAAPQQPPAQARAPAPLPDALTPRVVAAIARGRRIEVGVFGDSFGDGVWAGLDQSLRRRDGFEVHKFSERSTGFTRYRSLNLLDDVRAKLDRQPLDIAVLAFGANDTQGIYLEGHGNTYMSEGWQQIVGDRIAAIVHLLRERGIMVYWVGLPKMRDAQYDADIRAMMRFYAARMRALNVPYIDTAPLTADGGGQYAPYLTDPRTRQRIMARTNDGIHMTIPGYILLMRALAERISGPVVQARAQAGLPPPAGAPAPAGHAAGSHG